MIPEEIDVLPLLAELNRHGFRDFKIEIELGFKQGYINALKTRIRFPRYAVVAKIYNLYFKHVHRGTS